MNIFVSNLNFKVTNDGLKALFEPFGEVTSAKVITDKFSGKSRGFGFVEMSSTTEAQQAIDELHESDQDGRKINVTVAKPREEMPRRETNYNKQ